MSTLELQIYNQEELVEPIQSTSSPCNLCCHWTWPGMDVAEAPGLIE